MHHLLILNPNAFLAKNTFAEGWLYCFNSFFLNQRHRHRLQLPAPICNSTLSIPWLLTPGTHSSMLHAIRYQCNEAFVLFTAFLVLFFFDSPWITLFALILPWTALTSPFWDFSRLSFPFVVLFSYTFICSLSILLLSLFSLSPVAVCLVCDYILPAFEFDLSQCV